MQDPEQKNPITNPVVAPLNAPEQGGNPFIADMEHDMTPVPLTHMVARDFSKGFSESFDLLKHTVAKYQHLLSDNSLNDIVSNLSLNRYSGVQDPYGDQGPLRAAKFLTKDDYGNSQYFRKTLKYPNGVYEDVAKLDAQNYDNSQVYADEQARVSHSTWANMVQYGSGFAGGVSDPLFVLMAIATDGLGVAPWLARSIPLVKDSMRATRIVKSATTGFLIGEEGSAISYAKAKEYQEKTNKMQFLYSGIFGTLLGGVIGAHAPKLESDIGVTADLEKNAPGKYQISSVSQSSHEGMIKVAAGQLENNITPEIGEMVKEAHYQEHNSIAKQLERRDGTMDKNVAEIKNQREVLQDTLDRVNDGIPKEKDAEELGKLNTDAENLRTKIEDHDATIALLEKIPEKSSMEEVKASFNKLHLPSAETTYNSSDEKLFEPSSDQTLDQMDLETAKRINDKYKEIEPTLSEEAKKYAVDAEDVANKHDAIKKVYAGIRNCLVGEA